MRTNGREAPPSGLSASEAWALRASLIELRGMRGWVRVRAAYVSPRDPAHLRVVTGWVLRLDGRRLTLATVLGVRSIPLTALCELSLPGE